MTATLRILVSALLVTGATLVATPTGAQAAATLTVTPDTDLADGDVVTLDGAGFTSTGRVGFCQGVFGEPPDATDCGGPVGFSDVNTGGEFAAQYTVRRFISVSGIGTVDCAQPSANCAIAAANVSGFTPVEPAVITPITFTPQPPPSVTVTPDTGLVDGDVVTIEGTGWPPSWPVFCQGVFDASFSTAECGAPLQNQRTDDTGAFSAQYTVRRLISASPGAPLTIDCAAPSATCAIGVGLVSPPLSVVTPIAFTPQPPPDPISGIVTGPDGNPVAGADVWAYAPPDGFVASLQTTTDAQGTYAFTAFELDVPYRIVFRPPAGTTLAPEWYNDSFTREFATPISVSAGAFVRADAQLEEGGELSGTVTGPGGDPVAGVAVWAFNPANTWVASHTTTTAADGGYLLENVRATSYRLLFAPTAASGLAPEWYDNARTRRLATSVDVLTGQTLTGIDVQLEGAGAISGSVTDANGNPVADVAVRVYGPGDGFGGSYLATTAADGSYLFARVRPGDQYTVRFAPPTGSGLATEWYDNAATRSTAQSVAVAAGQTVTGIDAVLESST